MHAPNRINCHACGIAHRPVEHRAPFCLECWNITPLETRNAYSNGYITIRQTVDAIRTRRQSCASIGGGNHRRRRLR